MHVLTCLVGWEFGHPVTEWPTQLKLNVPFKKYNDLLIDNICCL